MLVVSTTVAPPEWIKAAPTSLYLANDEDDDTLSICVGSNWSRVVGASSLSLLLALDTIHPIEV